MSRGQVFNNCIVVLLFCLYFTNSTLQEYNSVSLHGPLTNLYISDDKVYVGGTNRIYVLYRDLSPNQYAFTCEDQTNQCKNINKVLVVNEKSKQVLLCGTGNGGYSEVRSLENINQVLRNSSQIQVSSDVNRPAQAILTKRGHVVVATTFGKGMSVFPKGAYSIYRYAISTRNFYPPTTTKTLIVEIKEDRFYDYVIYYKAAFQFNWNTYFVTNQKEYVDSPNFVSKLVRLCQNDDDYDSYTDIVMQCKYNNTIYNLIQDSVLIEPHFLDKKSNAIFIGVFAKGRQATAVSGDSVICVTTLSNLDAAILTAKKKSASERCGTGDRSKRYLSDVCSDLNNKHIKRMNFTCENAEAKFYYTIGNVSVMLTGNYILREKHGLITSVHGTSTSDGHIIAVIGTSTGKIYQMLLSGVDSPFEVFSQLDVHQSVRKVHMNADNTIYVMTDFTVFLLKGSNCSEFTSCSQLMKNRNPLCGWCVYKQRATVKSDCHDAKDHWIPSYSDCTSRMSISPSSIPVDRASENHVKVDLKPERLPRYMVGDIFTCRLVYESGEMGTGQLSRLSDHLSCRLPFIKVHTQATLQVSINSGSNKSLVLYQEEIMFFKCERFDRCSECVSRSGQQCEWCTGETRCLEKGAQCLDKRISDENKCPQLQDTRGRYFIHTGVMTSVKVYATNIPQNNDYKFTCMLSGMSHRSTTEGSRDSIPCSFNIALADDVPKQNLGITISYRANGERASTIDDKYQNFVTIYNCSLLAKDCSHCQALNKNKYNCAWCSDRGVCRYKDDIKSLKSTCPGPTIIKFVPQDGPSTGNTKITVFGYNFGSDISQIESVTVANETCQLSTDHIDFTLSESNDFTSKVPTRIVCFTSPSENSTSGYLSIAVAGKLTTSSLKFSYKIPVITDISPKFGPKAGGTRINISGKNIGVGNRNIGIELDDKPCLKPSVLPDLPLDSNFTGDFSIECVVDGGYDHNITSISLSIDGIRVINSAPTAFSFLDDPVVHEITPTKAFVSGGTKLDIQGLHLDHAHEAKLTLLHDQEVKVGKCGFKSSAKIVCKVPEASTELEKALMKTNDKFDCHDCIYSMAKLHLDGVQEEFEIDYYIDPVIKNLEGDDNIVTFTSSNRLLTIAGKRLNQVATLRDIRVTVGTELCALVDLHDTFLSCRAPVTRPPSGILNAELPEVNVTIGNIVKTVGYVQYSDNMNTIIVIVSTVAAAAFIALVISIGTFLFCRKYRRTRRKLKLLVRQVSIKQVTEAVLSSSENERGEDFGKRELSLYTDISDTFDTNLYSTVDDVPTKNMFESSTLPSNAGRPSFRVKNKITLHVDVEGCDENIVLAPTIRKADSYLHPAASKETPNPVNCEIRVENSKTC